MENKLSNKKTWLPPKKWGVTRACLVDKAVISQEVFKGIEKTKDSSGEIYGRWLIFEHLVQILSLSSELRGIPLELIGNWSKEKDKRAETDLLLVVNKKHKKCFLEEKELDLEIFDINDFDKRNKGLILSQKLKGKKALFISCGSVNSVIAREFVKHGITVHITDPDYLEIHNAYRWGVQEVPELLVGRAKVNAFADRMEAVCPGAKVFPYIKDFCKEAAFFDKLMQEIKPELIIVGTDTQDSRVMVNSLAYPLGIPVMYVALSDEAASGEIEIVSGDPNDACYLCRRMDADEEESQIKLRSTNQQYGADATQDQAGVPALSVDIGIINYIAAKIGLVMLSGGDVTEYMNNFDTTGTLMWFSTRPDTWQLENFAQKLVVTVLKHKDCPVCGKEKEAAK